MNALTVIIAAPIATPQDAWLDKGRNLFTQRRDVDWQIAGWMVEGKQAGHLCQAKFDFLSEQLGVAPKRLKDALKAAEAFPPALRDPTLSVEHHAAIASLPREEALPLLKRASVDHLPVNALREFVTQRRYETGQNYHDEDTDSTLCTLVLRAWNRATPEARELAFALIQTAAEDGYAVIDEDEVCS